MKPAWATRHIRLLIYLLPALMDMIVAQLLFINTVRLAGMGASASRVAAVVTVWSVVYLVVCPLVGRRLTVDNAARLMLFSAGIMAVLSCLFTMVSSVTAMYVLVAVGAAGVALFFPAFQVFMKAVDAAQDKPLTYSTGLYTFSWSMGFALGPFVSGWLMDLGGAAAPGHESGGWRYAYLLAGAAAVGVGIMVWLLRHLCHAAPATDVGAGGRAPRQPSGGIDYSRMPDRAWLGWLSAGVGVLVLSIIRGVFPARAAGELGLSASAQGTVFFLLSLSQALTGLVLCRSRLWMYRAAPVAVYGIVGIAGCVCFGYGRAAWVLNAGALLFGLYSGAFFFYLVFHALTHPSRSAQYVSVNESVVGAGGIIGPLFGGLLADHAGFGVAYLGGAALVLAVTIGQAAVHRRRPVQA